MSKIIADRMNVGDDELHFRDDDAQKKLKDLIVQEKGNSKTAVMSQAAATEEFDKLSEDIHDLNNTVLGGFEDLNNKDLWEQGHFKNGAPGESDALYYNMRIRTKIFIPTKVKMIVALENYLVSVFVYDEKGNFIEEFSRITWFSCESGKRYKVQLGISNTTEVTTEIWDKCGLYASETYIPGVIDKIDFDAYRNGYALSMNRNNYWEQGSFKSTGEFSDSTAEYFPLRVRTKNFIPVVDRIVVDAPYELNLFKFHKPSGEFIGELGNHTVYEGADLEFDKYAYKGQLRNGEAPSSILDFTAIDVESIVHFYADPLNVDDKCDKRKNIYIANAPTCYYSGLMGDNYASLGFSSDTTYDTVISLFDRLVTEHSSVFSRQDLGLSSNNKTICEYAMTPIDGDFITDRKLPKILIVCVQHGFEKSSVYGLYCFLHDLLNSWEENPVLEYIRHNVELRFIPIANPYGFDHNSYLNANGVNINRNYDTPGYPVYPDTVTGDLQYGGKTAFDQPETQIIRDWVLSNTDAIMLIDYHTKGSGSVTKYTDINWHDYPKTENDYLFSFRDASKAHIRKITAHFTVDYNLPNIGNNLCGHVTGGRGTPTAADLGVWGTMQYIPTMTFEGFNGFVGGVSFAPKVFKANSELIGNWLICIINHMISS